MQTFTRPEFYDLVWSKPITKIAGDLGVSDVAVHKICSKHDIPKPPRGHWAKIEHGKPVEVTPLPRLRKDISDQVVVYGSTNDPPSSGVAAAISEAKARIENNADNPTDIIPDPIVQRTLKKLRKAKPGDRGLVSSSGCGLIHVDIAPASIDHAERVLLNLQRALVEQSGRYVRTENSAALSVLGQTVAFSVTEKLDRRKHVPTEEEKKKLEKWEQDRSRRFGRSWDSLSYFERPEIAEWDYVPTGKLKIELEQVWGGGSALRRSFSDGKIQNLETMAREIAIGVVAIASRKIEREKEAKERAAREAEHARERAEAERRQRIEARREKFVETLVQQMQERKRLVRLKTAISAEAKDQGQPRLAAMLIWLDERVERLDECLSQTAIEERLTKGMLFDTEDEAKPSWAWPRE